MTSDELILAVNVMVRRLTLRLESGQILATHAYPAEEAALRAIEDAIVELVTAHVRLQKLLKK